MKIGIDIGSTSIKMVLLDGNENIIYHNYTRHRASIIPVLTSMLQETEKICQDEKIQVMFTGSIGMGVSERLNLAFSQEVVSSIKFIQQKHPNVKTFIDIGGEDAKMIFFNPNQQPDIRMNGNCAGGTGAFIDQMASLLGIPIEEINQYAENAETIYPIASRCGVFSKTDIQNLVSRNVSKNDIVGSIFHAVALQTISSLARGYDIEPKIFFCGGPFAYLPELKKAFLNLLQISESDVISTEYPELVPAYGSALSVEKETPAFSIGELLGKLSELHDVSVQAAEYQHLSPLFTSEEELEEWKTQKITNVIPRKSISEDPGNDYFLGIDSGSTTTKIVIINDKGEIVFDYYVRNEGDALGSFNEGIREFNELAKKAGKTIAITSSAVTGYGENLLKTAYNLHYGIVETMAHYLAAAHISSDVSFILDIGGQDMKAIFVEDGNIKRLEINEACSSGCGSFIEGFANMLGMPVKDFAVMACRSKHPSDLGTRCTVFMNSKVKQTLREGAALEDIAAGLSYSVIKNCLFKVLKLKTVNELGDKIVVQGGTFKNLSVIRCLELLTQKEVKTSNIPELMGAYGAALFARNNAASVEAPIFIDDLLKIKTFDSTNIQCKGCENLCNIKKIIFSNDRHYFSGNKCDKVFSNLDSNEKRGANFHSIKYKRLFSAESDLKNPILTIGIPRGLIFYENYPFWHTLLTACNIKPLLSGVTTIAQYEKGVKSIMADNICFPAKLMHGHIMYLIKKNVDRILYPYIVYEKKEDKKAVNSYNCPIVTGYSDVLKSSIETEDRYGIPLDAPVLNFNNKSLLTKSLQKYLSPFGVGTDTIKKAIDKALNVQEDFDRSLASTASDLFQTAQANNQTVIVLAGRPYHIDPLIQHKISDAIANFGVTVINEDIVRYTEDTIFDDTESVTQWAFPNRILNTAKWVSQQPQNVHFVQLTSFGCGPDAFIIEEVKQILQATGKNLTLLKVDDVNNIGSLKLRIRSLLESMNGNKELTGVPYAKTPVFLKADKHRKIIAPYFAEGYSELLPAVFKLMGLELEILPHSDILSNELGLQFANNEICYPATLVVGDIMKALQSGKYDPTEIAIAITQTGGQCRATNYISAIKKAMLAGGFDNIPVVSIAFGSGMLNNQPGFELKWSKSILTTYHAMLFADVLAKLYYPAAVREKNRGDAKRIRDKYLKLAEPFIEGRKRKNLQTLLESAMQEFSAIIDHTKKVSTIGVVGEIYVKYNSFSHKNVLEWLTEQGVEVVAPSIYNFFVCSFVNIKLDKDLNINKTPIPQFLNDTIFRYAERLARKFDKICADYPYYRPFSDLREDSQKASQIINLAAQFGEGWLIPAEIASFAESNVNNVISLQPFGCIANHVISKGIEKKIKKVYPKMNLLFLDFDGGTSEANVLNRLHFMVNHCKTEMKAAEESLI